MNYKLNELEQIFQRAIELPLLERTSFLEHQCCGKPGLKTQIEDLLDHACGAHTFVAENVQAVAASLAADPVAVTGERAGSYRLIRELGSGGMATVFLAVRDDGSFEQLVAVKIAKHGLGSPAMIDRFLRERQVLANLEHPNIARLLDGGSLDSGLPYLAMEYVEGELITDYTRKRQLSIEQRLRLFLGVCGAVAHAHQRLIVHRDVKPGNILVTRDGVPKLLDFGISKLIETGQQGQRHPATLGCSGFMTPEYASPEQVRGDPITTASDIYSLGAVLYELLTGQRPHPANGRDLAAILHAVCEDDPALPSSIGGRTLAGDLDNLLLKAMHKDPGSRYASVERLADDIGRYLQGQPLAARKPTFRYTASKFIHRHTFAVISATLLAFTLLSGIAATAWQARRVVEQVERAERRFLFFRRLANAFLFELHGKVARVQTPREARILVIETAIEYLDGLAREAGEDSLMMREIARGYEKIADAQGIRESQALGLHAGAVGTYRKALVLLEPLDRAKNPDHQVILLRARCYCNLGDVLEAMGDFQGARDSYESCEAGAARLDDRRLPAPRRTNLLARASGKLRKYTTSPAVR